MVNGQLAKGWILQVGGVSTHGWLSFNGQKNRTFPLVFTNI